MQTKITIGEVDFNLNLTVNWFYKYFLEITGIDLLANPRLEDATGVKAFEYAAAFVAAGYQANCRMNKTEVKHTKEAIEEMIMSLDPVQAVGIVLQLTTEMGGKEKNVEAPKKKGAAASRVG
jgi:hypothetical protein